jgi:hypothetical protein
MPVDRLRHSCENVPMSYSMLLAGELTLPAGRVRDYLGSTVEPSRHHDWIGMLEGGGDDGPAGTVEEVLKRLPRQVITAAGSWLKIELPGSAPGNPVLRIHGVLVEDDFMDHGTLLVAALRLAWTVGGQGEIYLLEEQVPFHPQEPELCYVVRVDPKGSSVKHVPEKDQQRVVKSPLFAPTLASLEAAIAAGQPKEPEPKAKAPAKKAAPASKAPAQKAPKKAGPGKSGGTRGSR